MNRLAALRDRLAYQGALARRRRAARQRRAGRRPPATHEADIAAGRGARPAALAGAGAARRHRRQRPAQGHRASRLGTRRRVTGLSRAPGRRGRPPSCSSVAARGYAGDIVVLMGVYARRPHARRARHQARGNAGAGRQDRDRPRRMDSRLRRQVARRSAGGEMGGEEGRRRLRPVRRRDHHAARRGQGGEGRAGVLRRAPGAKFCGGGKS